jgi:hypothetical protein
MPLKSGPPRRGRSGRGRGASTQRGGPAANTQRGGRNTESQRGGHDTDTQSERPIRQRHAPRRADQPVSFAAAATRRDGDTESSSESELPQDTNVATAQASQPQQPGLDLFTTSITDVAARRMQLGMTVKFSVSPSTHHSLI